VVNVNSGTRALVMKNKLWQTGRAGERGFSLIELMIAMAVTLIVCGAVVSLLMQGNRAFQIQPDMTERQQNIRAAMDLIMRDIANAGASVPFAMQVFTRGLFGAGPTAPAGGNSDMLEMLTNDSGQDPVPVCGAAGVDVWITPNGPGIPSGTPMMLVNTTVNTYSYRVTAADSNRIAGPPTGCGAVNHTHLTLNANMCGAPGNSVAGCTVQQVVFADLVRYYIAADPSEPNMLSLWRQSAAGNQVVARGIEDMRVAYRSGKDIKDHPTGTAASEQFTADNQPADMTGATTLQAQDNATVEVQVALAARGTLWTMNAAARKAVMTQAADGSFAYRGALVSRGTPRAALALLADGRWH